MATLEQIPDDILFSEWKHPGTLMCRICPRACILNEGEIGYCGIRINSGSTIISKTYGKTTGVSVDPIEKKPLYHFQPGTDTLSIGGIGCNLSCQFCQNFSTSQDRGKLSANFLENNSPQELVNLALKKHLPSISVTYNEPTINYEYVVDIAKAAHDAGLKVVAVTNGFLQAKAADYLSHYLDAANIDFKGPKDFYRNVCDARQAPVKKTIETWFDAGVHIEITTLVIPSHNDSNNFIKEESLWILNRLRNDVPLHFSRFYPMYLLNDVPPTPLNTLLRCKKIATEIGLKHIYIGNVGSEVDDNTYCSSCHEILIERSTNSFFRRRGYETVIKNYDSFENKCLSCGSPAPFTN